MYFSFIIFSFFITLSNSAKIDYVETCTNKLKESIGKNATLKNMLNDAARNDKNLIGFYVNTINDLCNSKEINATITFFTENLGAISSLTEFTQTLTPEEVKEFTKLQKNGNFAKELQFIKEKYDSAGKKEKVKLKKFIHRIIPMLLKGSNVKPAVINYFDNLSVPDLIKIMDIAEEHDLNQLKTFVVGTFAQLKLSKSDRADVGRFIDNIHKIKKAAEKHETKNATTSSNK